MNPSKIIYTILIIALVIGGLWLVDYIIKQNETDKLTERNIIFSKATEACYAKERSCDSIMENLREDLFPNE